MTDPSPAVAAPIPPDHTTLGEPAFDSNQPSSIDHTPRQQPTVPITTMPSAAPHHRLNLPFREPPSFSGTDDDLHVWLQAYNRTAAYNGWDDNAKRLSVPFALQATALKWFTNNEATLSDWPLFVHAITTNFAHTTNPTADALQLLFQRRQTPSESVQTYVQDVIELCNRVDPNMANEKRCEHIIKGLDPQIQTALLGLPTTTTEQLIAQCRLIEQRRSTFLPVSSSTPVEQTTTLQTTCEQLQHQIATLKTDLQALHVRAATGPSSPQPPRRSNTRRADTWRTRDDRPVCFSCSKIGHVRKHCPSLRRTASPPPSTRRGYDWRNRTPPGRFRSGCDYRRDRNTPPRTYYSSPSPRRSSRSDRSSASPRNRQSEN